MKKILPKISFVLIILGFSILILSAPYNIIGQVQTTVLFLTLAGVVYYAYETDKMRHELVNQNEANIQPFLLIYYRASLQKFRIRNAGKGIANKIEFNQTEILLKDGTILLKFSLLGENYLLPGEERDIEIKAYINGEEVSTANYQRYWTDSTLMASEIGLQVRTKNVSWTPYLFTFRFGPDGTYLKEVKVGENNCEFD